MTDAPTPPGSSPAAQKHYPTQAVQLVRTTTQTHLVLSQMADQKASILMGATFVVFTIVMGQAGMGNLPLPLLVLAVFSFLSAVCAVMVVMPSTRTPPLDIDRSNVLFFGVFTQMPEEEFTELIVERLATDEGMFRTMLRDVYQNGQVLQKKKYRYLGYAYRLFLAGLTLSLLTYVVAGGINLAPLL
ncbi:Pycsar system effector family protein [Novosphingobium mangrovi (ex Huang et al. 2023)]|uniref:DUF5706 domain-containing protein n=1 Tax=Novosphingobium mangrovi (ex Huang et al. 2023) TaxID=2976432 RepID=A0ABT2I9N9_9SPHN|nr:Pycsar system effector family protein [Novosphingobium mangrovi (ex Huang et al. 2023)]MCT2401544.1 DUF5706 domain-containing protein [Novosphingobium mangrovi (ex Huang et al. 2023)]